MGSIINLAGLMMDASAMLGQDFPRETRASAGNPMYNHYQCSDEKWLAVAHLQPDRYWPIFCKALGIENLENDERFNSIESRGKNAAELVKILDERFLTKTRDEWLEQLEKERCIATAVQTPGEVCNDPQALANNYFIDVDHPEAGKLRQVGFPWDLACQLGLSCRSSLCPRVSDAHTRKTAP